MKSGITSLAVLAALGITAPAAAGNWVSEVIATGLNNPRGLSIGPDGALYIAESGFYQPGGPTTVNPRGMTAGYSETGSITRVAGGTQTRIITGLPSIAVVNGSDVAGPQDIVFGPDGTGYVLIGLGLNPANRATDLAPVGSKLGQVWSFTPGGVTPRADVAAFELANNPAGGAIDSNPFHMAVAGSELLVTDAGANSLLKVNPVSGDVSLIAAFPPRFIGPPAPFSDSVSTGVAVGPNGNYYVAELTGFPFTPGAARIYQVTPDGTVTIAHEGFTMITDIAFGPGGSLFVLELDSNGLAQPGGSGQLIRLSNGKRTTILSGLVTPTGLEVDARGRIYVTNFSAAAGIGQVLAISYVPEPTSWALLITGFGAIGMAARRRRAHVLS